MRDSLFLDQLNEYDTQGTQIQSVKCDYAQYIIISSHTDSCV